MVETKRHRYRIACEVLDQVASALRDDPRVKGHQVSVSKAEGQWVERLALSGVNGAFELQVEPNGVIQLGQLKEWPVHPGDEGRTAEAVRYLTDLIVHEATGVPFTRGPVGGAHG